MHDLQRQTLEIAEASIGVLFFCQSCANLNSMRSLRISRVLCGGGLRRSSGQWVIGATTIAATAAHCSARSLVGLRAQIGIGDAAAAL